MVILVTGVFGFLGYHVTKRLAENHTVVGLYRSPNNQVVLNNVRAFSDIELVDITPDVVVMCHAAVSSGGISSSSKQLFLSNVDFTDTVIKRFPNSRLIYISSVSIFENKDRIIHEKSINSPVSEYALSKYWGEMLVKRSENYAIIRFASLYGMGMNENTIIPNYCNQALKFNSIKVWGTGERVQNYIHVEDAVSLIEKVMSTHVVVDFPILGVSTQHHSNREVATLISGLTGADISYVNNDNSLSFVYDNQLTRSTFNWTSTWDLSQGLNQFVKWKKGLL